ncbi:MAG: bifunctional nuclease family protein [Ignavibacteria bacterium]|nr:bifunctional nuclease family protein [Ignavibacteria bacterium]MBK6772166.1 bifunctional nuclease family protein [Ignavibacteria bacterium]MBK7157334.1 bifunctional nuclease family protein [Ignavibacteria bacterium]MBK7255022.1 bifunctional nuclease family protein [Ignavibacteria bacterium]MBK7446781.1 bifunctional nuclease family protein [Ignavibacteria bacterium]
MENSGDAIQVDIFGLSLTPSISGGGYAIILKEIAGSRRLPIIIGQYEAQSIALELEGIKPPRPLTHDLLKEVIEVFGYSINYITISELKDSTFYAKIKFDSAGIEEMDARPSDAIAIALKFSAPIYVNSEIMDEVGFVPDYDEQVLPKEEGETEESPGEFNREQVSSKSADTAKNLSNKDKKIIQLKSELDEAISKEDYEKAAQIRDELKKMEISNLN